MIINLRRRRPWLVLLLITAVTGAILIGGGTAVRHAYPLRYEALIIQAARANGVDPYLLVALIRVESRFRPLATSRQDARGLMQVMPGTGVWVAGQLGMPDFHPDDLYRPDVNIRIGTWYLAEVRRWFGDNTVAALAAYNAGDHNVRAWLDSGQWDGTVGGIGAIPFEETRNFVRAVLRDEEIYRFLDRFLYRLMHSEISHPRP